MEPEVKIIDEKLTKLADEVALLKELLLSNSHRKDPEGELSGWAEAELDTARNYPRSKFVPLEEAKRRVLKK